MVTIHSEKTREDTVDKDSSEIVLPVQTKGSSPENDKALSSLFSFFFFFHLTRHFLNSSNRAHSVLFISFLFHMLTLCREALSASELLHRIKACSKDHVRLQRVNHSQVHKICRKQNHKGLIFDIFRCLCYFCFGFFFLSVSVWHTLSERRRGRDSAGSSIICASLLAWGEDIIYSATFVPLEESDNLLTRSNQWSNLDPPKRPQFPGTDFLCYTNQALKLYTVLQTSGGQESGKRRGFSAEASMTEISPNLSTTLYLSSRLNYSCVLYGTQFTAPVSVCTKGADGYLKNQGDPTSRVSLDC